MTQWRIEGTYMETCSCDFLCPCPTSAFGAPDEGRLHLRSRVQDRSG